MFKIPTALAFIFACLVVVGGLMLFSGGESKKPAGVIAGMSNEEILAELGQPVASGEQGCIQPRDGFGFGVYPDEVNGRILIVCVPLVASGPAN